MNLRRPAAALLATCALVLLLTPMTSRAAGATGTLCAAGERPVFSCPSGGRTISVCASADLSATGGYLKYRFGRSQEQPELIYPKDASHPRRRFRFYSDGFAKGSGEQLSFSIGAYTYTVFAERSTYNFNSSGVLVKAADKLVARLTCDAVRPATDELWTLKDLGLPVADYELDVCPDERPCRS